MIQGQWFSIKIRTTKNSQAQKEPQRLAFVSIGNRNNSNSYELVQSIPHCNPAPRNECWSLALAFLWENRESWLSLTHTSLERMALKLANIWMNTFSHTHIDNMEVDSYQTHIDAGEKRWERRSIAHKHVHISTLSAWTLGSRWLVRSSLVLISVRCWLGLRQPFQNSGFSGTSSACVYKKSNFAKRLLLWLVFAFHTNLNDW